MQTVDVIVVGLGAMGSAAVFALAQRGVTVLGVDRFDPPHAAGSSHGESRVFRMAYFEDPAYVPLLRLALQHWRKLEAQTGEQVLRVTGILEAGYPGAVVVANSLRSSIEHGLPHEVIDARQLNRRFPAFSLPHDWDCVYQPDGGVLRPEKAIGLFLSAAQALGATVSAHTCVREVRPFADRVDVALESGEVISAGSAVIAAGPWMADLLPEWAGQLTLTRQPLVWFEPREPELVQPERMPVFLLQTPEDEIYGFPDLFGSGVKVASHRSGGVLPTADARQAEVSAAERATLAASLERYVPAAAGASGRTACCIYTRTPDEHFVLGLHPAHSRLVLASPCSGHGFKFASIVGEVLADLATTGGTEHPIGLFDPGRLGRF